MKRKVVICVCGMAGCGKSTVARRLAEKYGFRYVSGGDALRALAAKLGFDSFKKGWWESEQGAEFLRYRMKNPLFDRRVDEELMRLARAGNVVLDSWTMPWLLKDCFKVWLRASFDVRARRVAERNGISLERAFEVLREKEERTKAIYRKLYGFRLGDDFSPFDLVLDTDVLGVDEVFEVLCVVIDNVLFRKRV